MNKYYFAYGSNMDESRLHHRNVNFFNKFPGKLLDYKLCFEEFVKTGKVFANVVPSKGDVVEGIVYEVDDTVKELDEFEYVPVDYFRENKAIKANGKDLKCIIYIGNTKNIDHDGLPAKAYMDHVLKGKPFLSERYFQELEKIKTKEMEFDSATYQHS